MAHQDVLAFAHEVLVYLRDIFDLTQCSEFEEGTFQVYHTLGRSMTVKANTNASVLNAKLMSELGSRLDIFNESWQLHSGLCMESLWKTFRPASARNLQQLESSNQIKDLAKRFDGLKWISGTPIQELYVLQRSITGIHDAIGSAEPLELRSLEVYKHSFVH